MPRTRATTLALLTVTVTVMSGLLAAVQLAPAQGVPAGSTVATTGARDALGRTGKTGKTVVLRSRAIPMGAGEIPNAMRGEYEWLGSATVPEGFPGRDVYYRDQVVWSRIEPSPGVYDFTWFDRGLARARELGGKLGFRVMAWCPGCWVDATPTWLPRQPGSDAPDWNNETFLSSWEQLMAAIAARYADDPALGWVDVGGYGAYGEWQSGGPTEITVPNAVRLMSAVLDRFRNQHVVVNAMVPKYVDAAMALSPRMGLRADCLGEFNMFSLIPTSAALQDRWKTAPVLSEWCNTPTSSTTLGAQQVRDYHVSQVASPVTRVREAVAADPLAAAGLVDAAKSAGYRYVLSGLRVPRRVPRTGSFRLRSLWRNDGSAPTYDAWQVTLQLRKRGTIVASADLGVDLRTVLPGSTRETSNLSLGRLRTGRYALWVTVTDPTGYLAPMNLAIDGRSPDGAYLIGRVYVARRQHH